MIVEEAVAFTRGSAPDKQLLTVRLSLADVLVASTADSEPSEDSDDPAAPQAATNTARPAKESDATPKRTLNDFMRKGVRMPYKQLDYLNPRVGIIVAN